MAALRSAAAAALISLTVAAPARAADPIMPLRDVHKGMKCTGYSVIQGTDISSFDVEIVDVVAGDPGEQQPLILVRVSGPAVDPTGIAEGFSGSPIYCPDDQGTQRVVGAIAYSTADYGGHVVLATPIESILGQPVDPPSGARSVRHYRALRAPISVTGIAPALAPAFKAAAKRDGRAISVAPYAPLASAFPVQTLRPGASLAVGLASGDVTAGAVGTVAYVDGDKVWGFGHPFDAVGRRDLFLQDAYVYAVIGNPVGTGDAVSEKLAAPGHDLGTLSADGPNGVAGRTGALPPRIPVRILVKDGDTNEQQGLTTQVADEYDVGNPSGSSGLSLVAPMALAQAAFTTLEASPARTSGQMCARISVKESKKPMGFCNTYVGAGGGPVGSQDSPIPGAALVSDLAEALGDVDAFQLGEVHVTGVVVTATLVRGLRQGYLVSIKAPKTIRRGHSVKVDLKLQHVYGKRENRTITVKIPSDAPTGERDLWLIGTSADGSGDSGTDILDLGGGSGDGNDAGPKSVSELSDQIGQIHRYDGVYLSLRPPGSKQGEKHGAYRDPQLRLSGSAHTRVTVER